MQCMFSGSTRPSYKDENNSLPDLLVPFPDRFVDTVKLPLTLDSRLREWE